MALASDPNMSGRLFRNLECKNLSIIEEDYYYTIYCHGSNRRHDRRRRHTKPLSIFFKQADEPVLYGVTPSIQ